MDAFLSGPDGAIFSGHRGMGTEELVVSVMEAFEEAFPDAEILVAAGGDGLKGLLSMFDGEAVLFIPDVANYPDWESDVASLEKPPRQVYYGQELCHQVPACVKKVP